MNNNNQLPLKHVRVIDFGQQIAGPAVGMVLADQGATVIHIDPPEGPQWDHAANAVLHRNKLCINLDLKTPEGLAKALELIAEADVVLESFRPGTMKKLGIDFEQLRQQRPELITVSVPGFASNDQLRREWKATEAIVATTSGVFNDMGFNRVLMGVDPSFSPVPLGSSYAISLAASSTVFALFEREKTGRGDSIEVPVAAALMEGLCYNSIEVENMPRRYINMREEEIERRQQNNIPMDISYDDLQEYLDPFFKTYRCADGRFFYCVCPSHRNHARRCLEVLGIYDEVMAAGMPDVADLHLPISEWDGETSLGVYPLPKKWAHLIAEKMEKAFLTKTSEEWGVLFGEGQIPGAPHRSTEEWVNSEHTNSAKLIVEVDDPVHGRMKQPGPLAWFENSSDELLQPKPRKYVTPSEALEQLKLTAAVETITRPQNQDIQPVSGKGWLEGLRVLDLTNVIAGPHSCAFLGRFGAEVIKLDPVTPLYDPMIGIVYAFIAGQGKQSALIDIMNDEGRNIFNQLVKSVDLVVINAPERQIKPLGLDHESLQAINPGLLFCRLDCLGGPRPGPKTNYLGYDDIIQAISGIMTRFGGADTPEEHAHIGTLDVNCGFAAGLSIGLALYHKLKTGEVTRARTSLSAVTNYAQIPFAFDYEGRPPFNTPSGRDILGNHELSRFYPTQNGWIFIDSKPSELSNLEQIEDLQGIASTAHIEEFLTKAFAKASSEYWAKVLQNAGIAAAKPNSIHQLREQNSRLADGTAGLDNGSYSFSIMPDHPSGHKVTHIDSYAIRPTEAAIKSINPTQRFGHSTRDVLSDLGYSHADIETLIENKVAGLGWGKEYLPS
ncbi:CoA transferase [Bacterioplanoides sp. SCSIO 12839]|uniref:CoA transferase n=1 Tax=Bacterioplanoides sp. SCSIO 12839 TaxID=2829569 RepID=UPI002103E8DD|nr:CoA transferase [Bacterioplanoides sp. SCSIO 12839]UTW47485.1 CoA transferase [Bacterioplanoides sp. SCSIO 12839]